MPPKPFQEIHPGQRWSVQDNYRGARRTVEILNTTPSINDPSANGDRAMAANVDTGYKSYLKASTLRRFWRLEQEAPTR